MKKKWPKTARKLVFYKDDDLNVRLDKALKKTNVSNMKFYLEVLIDF